MNACPYCRTENAAGAVRCAQCTSWLSSRPLQREWYRAREGKMIAGVCRGLADRFSLPVALARALFIASIFAGGWGIVAYVALWIAMPLEPQPAPAAPAQPPVVPGPLVTPPPSS